MIRDLETHEDDAQLESDICIIGAGAAGITLALQLAKSGQKVTLCEGGGLDQSDASQSCYIGEVRGDPYFGLDWARLRYLGGTTNHWSGWCRTFESIDFDRSYIAPEHRWPITKSDLDPFLEDAGQILEITPDFNDGPADASGIKPIGYRFSPPTRFGEKYFEQLKASQQIELVLNANLIATESAGGAISAARFKSYSGTDLTIRAQKYVLAMGGIENSRMLLWLQSQAGDGLLKTTLPIGNYWMEHPHFLLGMAFVETEVSNQWTYGISGEVQRNEKILNCGFRVDEISKEETEKLLADLQCVAPAYADRIAGMIDEQKVCGAQLRSAWEQEPVRSNSVELSTQEKDIFGIPRVVLNWKKSTLDKRTIRKSVEIFNQWLMDNDLGRIKPDTWVLSTDPYPTDDELAGFHHMGGTRMGSDHKTSVVDGNCKVHGTANMYVAGSSVFTTSGHNNPTLPIVQLALRLADHLVE